jgi:hypothetical protein
VVDRARQAGIQIQVIATGSVDCRLPLLKTVTEGSGGHCQVATAAAETSVDALAAQIWAGPDD